MLTYHEVEFYVPHTETSQRCCFELNRSGHYYKVTVWVRGKVNAETGKVVSNERMDQAFAGLPVAAKALSETATRHTAEAVAEWLWLWITTKLGLVHHIEVSESDSRRTSGCVYYGPDPGPEMNC